MTRTAQCHCGALRLTCEGEPHFVAMCHCDLCKRRTGSAYSLGAWFDKNKVVIEGEAKRFIRYGEDSGAAVVFSFCPDCGSSVSWEMPEGSLPDQVGVAVGGFADAAFPAPTLSVHDPRKMAWVKVPDLA